MRPSFWSSAAAPLYGSGRDLLRRISTPWLARSAASVVLIALFATGVGLVMVPWQQSVRGTGRVVAYAPTDREQPVDAPISGRVVKWWVIEGSKVKAGDPIVELVDVDPMYVERLQERQQAARDRLTAAEERARAYAEQAESYAEARGLAVRSAALKVKMAGQKIAAARQKLAAAKAEAHTAALNLTRQRRLADAGLASKRAVEVADLESSKAAAQLNLYEAELSEAMANLTAMQAEQLRTDAEGAAKVQAANAEAGKAQGDVTHAREDVAKLSVEVSRQSSQKVLAPRDGIIFSLLGGEGGTVVKAGDRLAVLVPDTESRAVEMWIDGNDVPLLSTGRKVRLQFEGWPAVQFVGWPSVAIGTFGGRIAIIDATTASTGKFRVLVVPDEDDTGWPSSTRLRQGVRAKGWVLLDRVRLGWELWRQFNGFPPTLSTPPEDARPKDGKSP